MNKMNTYQKLSRENAIYAEYFKRIKDSSKNNDSGLCYRLCLECLEAIYDLKQCDSSGSD